MPTMESVTTAAVVLLAACAVVLTGMNIRETIVRRGPADPIRSVSDWHAYAQGGHRTGADDSRVTIVLFSDYECPACKAAVPHIAALRDKYPSAVSVVVRHFPIDGHRFARPAAVAAVCAAEQERFEEFDKLLFARSQEFGNLSWADFAVEAGVPDGAAFAECLRDGRAAAAVQADVEAGTRLGVSGTPTLLVNGDLYVGIAGLESIVQRHLRRTSWWQWPSRK
jgi:protein-disulfide isomerase